MTSTTAVPALIRTAARAVLAKEQAEGVGARVRRSIGTHSLRNFDPFLMLDEFHVAPPAGFSDHPHRGFETVTYMLKGEFEHEDFAGHRGRIAAGDLQWMTAGRGIVHAEVPVADENAGLQLWVNLPGKDKMMEPRYQELRGAELPTVTPADGVSIKLIAGEAFGASAKVHTLTPICYFDVTMGADAKVNLPVPSGFNVFLYILEGSLSVGGNLLAARQHECVVLDPVTPGNDNPKSEVPIVASPSGSRFVFIGGEPIGEQIYQHGPFVMNSAEEIRQAMVDYHAGKNGFERAPEFRSEISSRVARW
ncbi:RmlC-like cupin domain-containing protein [Catenaria anguillulae PL171]|uniref:RmlC-like cupin domain-containing protein n=1 Tax=Catenaria anguillulae PL171 TaxID=765915 RepID=A0A1Y2HL28_9FUNG|nr:RmlC-like cupin domain-containing protein [Catenaria anguillulae PL171]